MGFYSSSHNKFIITGIARIQAIINPKSKSNIPSYIVYNKLRMISITHTRLILFTVTQNPLSFKI